LNLAGQAVTIILLNRPLYNITTCCIFSLTPKVGLGFEKNMDNI